MNQQQREWNIFGHVLTTSDLSIYILMFVALLSGVASIWVGMIATVLAAIAVLVVSILVWRTTMKHKVIRIALFVIEAFIGLSAIQGGILLLQGAFDQVLRVAWLAGTPFSDYTIPGLVLVIVVGGSALLAAATVFIQREWAVLVSVLAGLLTAGYEVVEAISLDSKVGNVLPTVVGMQLLWFVPGLVVFGLAGYLWMREYRSQHFHLRHASHA
jgi:ABC-type Fe3+-siderophore transport system permease subunit